MSDFGYLDEKSTYFDSTCQSLRPQPVIDALNEYYMEYNSCGERVKYEWGRKVDDKVAESRQAVLDLLKLNGKHYFVSFTLNTTYGLNLLLSQLNLPVDKVITSEIEHNSVFLSTIEFAKKHDIERVVLERQDDGSIDLDYDFARSLVVMNTSSNVDGRELKNIKELVKKVKKSGGFVIIDAAQTLGSNYELLQKIQADAICSSAHKMYSASLGIMVVRKDLLPYVETNFVGGGMVSSVTKDSYTLLGSDHARAIFEPGLQAWGEIIALKTAINWLQKAKKTSRVNEFAGEIYDFLQKQPGVKVLNKAAAPVISFSHESLDGHLIAKALSDEGIMVRSGYFCAHYYLKEKLDLPHQVRISIGLHNTEADITKLKNVLERIFN